MNKVKVEQSKQDRGVEGPREGCDDVGKTGFIREEGSGTEADVVLGQVLALPMPLVL